MSVDEQKRFIDTVLQRDASGQFKFIDTDGTEYSHQAVVGRYIKGSEVSNAAKYGHKIFG
jgi:hypothetical protein